MKMRITEFARLTGVSVRTLHYYDEIGLLKPCFVDAATGYRYYDELSMQQMQTILFYRELDFPLKSILVILSSPDYDKEKVLSEQKRLLILKKERLERLIDAVDEAMKGEIDMSAFDQKEWEQYKEEVRRRWGTTAAYAEYTDKSSGRTADSSAALVQGMDRLFADFADCLSGGQPANSEKAQQLVKKLQAYISEHFYTCTDEILANLGQMYAADERFRKSIDKHGSGTAVYVSTAVAYYCGK